MRVYGRIVLRAVGRRSVIIYVSSVNDQGIFISLNWCYTAEVVPHSTIYQSLVHFPNVVISASMTGLADRTLNSQILNLGYCRESILSNEC